MRYKYKARDQKLQLVTGEVEAPNAVQAAKLLKSRTLIVVDLAEARKPLEFMRRVQERVKDEDVTNFTRQMATMIKAGLPITEVLVILRTQSKGALQDVVSQVLADVEGGSSLSAALQTHPKVFTPSYIALIKSGEAGGVLDDVLVRLADNLEKREEFKGKVKGALIYPVIVVAGMIVVSFIMLVYVIPRLTSLYTELDAELPFATKFLIGVSGFASQYWYVIIIVVAVAAYAIASYRRTPKGKRKTDEFLYRLPIAGELSQKVTLAELTRTLSLMIGAGVSILDALMISSKVVENAVIGDALTDAAKMVEKGFPISFTFAKHPEAFPFILSQMVAVGEETGKLDEVLAKVSHVFEVESDQKVKALTSAVEPIILMLLGIGVAFLVIAIILPIYNLTTQL